MRYVQVRVAKMVSRFTLVFSEVTPILETETWESRYANALMGWVRPGDL